jgi:hypothetical protein
MKQTPRDKHQDVTRDEVIYMRWLVSKEGVGDPRVAWAFEPPVKDYEAEVEDRAGSVQEGDLKSIRHEGANQQKLLLDSLGFV